MMLSQIEITSTQGLPWSPQNCAFWLPVFHSEPQICQAGLISSNKGLMTLVQKILGNTLTTFKCPTVTLKVNKNIINIKDFISKVAASDCLFSKLQTMFSTQRLQQCKCQHQGCYNTSALFSLKHRQANNWYKNFSCYLSPFRPLTLQNGNWATWKIFWTHQFFIVIMCTKVHCNLSQTVELFHSSFFDKDQPPIKQPANSTC